MRINDATLNYTRAIADLPAGGNIGTAATTVDIASAFNINQTTAGQTITLPNPTDTTAGRTVIIANVGSVAFTLITAVLSINEAATMLWNGTTWVFSGIDPSASTTRLNQITAANGVNGINNLNNAQLWSWNTLTNQNAMSLFSTTITSGTLFQVGSSSANIHPGALVKISQVSAAATGRALEVTSTTAGAMTNGIVYNLFTGAFTNEGIKVNATTMATGTLALYTTSAMTTGNILKLENLNAASTGASLLLSTVQTGGSVLFLNNATLSTGVGISATGNAITTGAVARFSSTGATITTGSILNVAANSTGTATNGLVFFQNSNNSSGVLLGLDNATTTGITQKINANSTTTGTALQINATALTTGYGLDITTNGVTSVPLRIGNGTVKINHYVTNATPEAAITGTRGDIANVNDGTNGKLYVKATGAATNTGWEELSTLPAYGMIYMTANATDTIIAAANTPVLVAGTTTLGSAFLVDMPANNRIRYTGTRTRTFMVSVDVGYWVASNNRACYIYLYKGGVQEANSKQGTVSRNTSESQDGNLNYIISLATNEYLEVWMENAANAHDITVQQLRVVIQSLT